MDTGQAAEWDRQARIDARRAVWSEDVGWEESIAEHLAAIVPHIAEAAAHDDALIVELGCGVGRLTHPMAAIFDRARILGYDVSNQMLAAARRRLWHQRSPEFHWCDGHSVPLPDETVDAAYSMLMFQHIPDRQAEAYVAELRRVLRPGGVAHIQIVEGEHADGLDHRRPVDRVVGWMHAEPGVRPTWVDIRDHPGMPDWVWMTMQRPPS